MHHHDVSTVTHILAKEVVGFHAKTYYNDLCIILSSFIDFVCEYLENDRGNTQYDCVPNEVHVVAPLHRSFECNTTPFDQFTTFYGNEGVRGST